MKEWYVVAQEVYIQHVLHTTVYWKEKAFTIRCYLIISSKRRGVAELKQLHRILFPGFQEKKLHL